MTSKAKKTKTSNGSYLPQDLREDINQLLDDIIEIGNHLNA